MPCDFTWSVCVPWCVAFSMKTLGVIGGLGPAATAYFYELLTSMAKADTDQEHLEAIIISRPSIPDRTAYILGKSEENPVVPMIEAGRMLASMGADIIAIPCVTSHFFFDKLSEGIGVPIVHMIRETVGHLVSMGVRSAGLMATDGTIASGVFNAELEAGGIRAIIPCAQTQARVMDLIYKNIKANMPFDIGGFLSVSDELRAAGAETVVLACTELSLINRGHSLSGGYVDALEVLARRCLELCGCAVNGLQSRRPPRG